MTSYPYAQAVRAAIDSAIGRWQEDLASAAPGAPLEEDERRRIAIGAARAPSPAAEEIVTALDARIDRLEQVRDYIDEDHELAALIDSVIGQRVQQAERRQARLSVLLTVISLIAGWLLSLIGTPAMLAHLIGRGSGG